MNKGVGFALFIFGAAAGSLVAWRIAKQKYERIMDEEIQSIKDSFANKNFARLLEKPELSEVVRNIPHYVDVVGQNAEVREPYPISSEEFSENDDYRKVSLIFYNGETLVDDEGDEIENADELIGADWTSRIWDVYKGDSVYVRNEQRGVDYEILFDERDFSEI